MDNGKYNSNRDRAQGEYVSNNNAQRPERSSENRNYYNNDNRNNYSNDNRNYYNNDNRNSYSNNRFSGRPPKGGKPKPKAREKTETQEFLMMGEEKIETLFPVPVNASLPHFQRSVGMAEGTIVEANEKGNGTIEIDGFKYPMKENRSPVIQKRYPLTKYIGKTIKFSFYPTITTKGIKILGLKPESPPFIKISNFRRELPKQSFIEVLGTVKEIKDDYYMVSIWSASSRKEYVVVVFGKCEAKIGDFVKIEAVLRDGLIRGETTLILNKK